VRVESKLNEVEEIKQRCKISPIYEDSAAQTEVQRRSKRVVQEANGPGEIVATTGCPCWGAQPVVEGRTVVRPGRTTVRPGSAAAVRVFLLRLFVFRRFLLCFCFKMPMYLDLRSTQFIPNTLPFAFYLHLSFRLVLERERGSGEELSGIRYRASIERFKNRLLDEQILSLLLSFLISSLCLEILL